MALIACPECQQKISDAAPACPHCGYPLSVSSLASPAHVQTVEQTSKRYKAIAACSVVMMLVGAFLCIGSCGMHSGGEITPVGPIMAALGLLIYLVNRILIWWHNE